MFDRVADEFYMGLASLENPQGVGFFSLIYVDKDVTVSGAGQELNLKAGWNIFTFRLPEDGEETYAVSATLDDVVLDVFLPEPPG